MAFKDILHNLPEVKGPIEKKLGFKIKLKWTITILSLFFVLANIPLYGVKREALMRYEYIAILLGTDFGSIISLGIGPIVMASIVLQLFVGSKILNIDLTNPEGKRYFQGLQKLLVFFFIIFESVIYVLMGGTPSMPGFEMIVIFQLMVGGILILFMDEICHKWGFGSGVSLFIAAGVGWRLITGLFGFLNTARELSPIGAVPKMVYDFFMINDITGGMQALAMILSTAIIFLIIVWVQSLKIEIPLSYDRLRGYNVKWPLAFFYASNIPVILTGAFVANIQLFGSMLQNWLGHSTFLGDFSGGDMATSGLAFWLGSTDIVGKLITNSFEFRYLFQAFSHILVFIIFSAIFSVFWVKTSGMDAQSQARNIIRSGLQIPGFRKDERILESILARYIMPLTVMGGIAVGLLAAVSDVTGTITGGTALLLGVMITFQFYQNIAHQHAMDMHPALKKMMG